MPPTPTPTANYDPTTFFTSPTPASNRVLLILNAPLTSLSLLKQLWRTSAFRICADGGANRLYDVLEAESLSVEKKDLGAEEGEGECGGLGVGLLPDHIIGDLDSLRPAVRAYYSGHNVTITHDPDQYSTDFGKAIKLIQKYISEKENSATGTNFPPSPIVAVSSPVDPSMPVDVLIHGSIAGRLDHGLGLLHELGREHDRSPDLRLWLISECSISFVLPAGTRSVIQISAKTKGGEEVLDRHVGIIPLYERGAITTKGLEWDVQDWDTRMDGQVSTSNRVVEDVCEIETDVKVLFTIERRMFSHKW